jgi:hypothetical protein
MRAIVRRGATARHCVGSRRQWSAVRGCCSTSAPAWAMPPANGRTSAPVVVTPPPKLSRTNKRDIIRHAGNLQSFSLGITTAVPRTPPALATREPIAHFSLPLFLSHVLISVSAKPATRRVPRGESAGAAPGGSETAAATSDTRRRCWPAVTGPAHRWHRWRIVELR